MATAINRLLVGRALRTEDAAHERLTKKTALADYLNRVIGMFHSNKEGPSGYAARCGTTSGSYGNPARREFNWQRAGGVSWAWIMRNPDLTGNSGPRPLPPTNLTVH